MKAEQLLLSYRRRFGWTRDTGLQAQETAAGREWNGSMRCNDLAVGLVDADLCWATRWATRQGKLKTVRFLYTRGIDELPE